jgi:protein involved in sex pheromone biosynthesis
MKKIAIGLIAIVVLVTFASGCTNNNNSTGNNSSVQNNSSMQNDQNVTLQINSNSSWNGTLSYKNGTQNINGSGSATYDLGQNPGNVTVNLQKTGNDNGIITLQLLKGGTIIVYQSTTSNQGTVSLSYTS